MDSNPADLAACSGASEGMSDLEAHSAQQHDTATMHSNELAEACVQPAAGEKLVSAQHNRRKRSVPAATDNQQPQKQKKQKKVQQDLQVKARPTKKNRLGQRARQQLGRVKQSQQMAHQLYCKPPVMVSLHPCKLL